MNPAILLWGVVFSSIGLGFFIYGKRQQRLVSLLCGLALMIFPYFVSSAVFMVLIGTVLTAIPFVIKS